MKRGYIYKLTLNQDLEDFKKGEIYIGKHNGAKAYYFSGGKLIKRIIKKYTTSVFDRNIICSEIDNDELLCYLEIYYIKLFSCNRIVNNTGLNLTDGGEGTSGYKLSEKQIQKLSDSLKENYRKSNRRPPKEKQVHQYNYDTGEYIKSFDNCTIAAREVDATSSSIGYAARDICACCKGYMWSYNKMDVIDKLPRKIRIIHQYDLQGNFIKAWKGLKEITKELNISASEVSNCYSGRAKTSNGFVWKLTDEKRLTNQFKKYE
jgi:NUMOD1 domain-containing protein